MDSRIQRMTLPVIGILLVATFLAWWANQLEIRLFALDVQTGSIVWSSTLPKPVGRVPQVFTGNGKVIVDIPHPTDKKYEESRQMIAFDAVSGQQLWEFIPNETLGETKGFIEDVPIIITDSVYIRFEDQNDHIILAALDASSGEVSWTQPSALGWQLSRQAAIQQAGERLVALFWEDKRCTLSFLDPKTGNRIDDIRTWFYDDEEFGFHKEPYLLADDDSIFLRTARAIYAFETATGAQRYELEEHDKYIWLEETTLYVGGTDQVKAFDALTGEERWLYERVAQEAYFTNLRADSETVYRFRNQNSDANEEGWLFALDAQNGNERWARPTTNDSTIVLFQAVTSPNTTDKIIVPGSKGEQTGIMVLSAADGTELWHFIAHTGFPSPASDGKQVFVVRKAPRWRNWLSLINPSWY